MAPYRLVQISDIHLDHASGRHMDNWEVTLDWLAETRPDMVVVSGDVSFEDCDDVAGLDFARAQLDRIPAPWKVLPGNHDIGDNVMSGGSKLVTDKRRDRWVERFGVDYWTFETPDWTFIGLNAQTLHSNGLACEREQSKWLLDTLAGIRKERQIALFIHKPLFMDSPSEVAFLKDCIDPVGRAFIYDAFRFHNLKMIASGHKHQYRAFLLDGIYYMWAPSSSSINHLPDVKMWGLREVGFIDYQFQPERFRHHLRGRDFLFRHEAYVFLQNEADKEQRARRF